MKEAIKIRNSSQELFSEVMDTIPVYPCSLEIKMLAQGISIPESPNELEQYLSLCNKNNVIPFSHLNFENSGCSYAGLDIPTTDNFKDYKENLRKFAISGLCRGGKFHLINSVLKNRLAYLSDNHREACKRIFTEFKDSVFDNLKRQEYEVQDGRLVFTESGGILFFNRGDGSWSKGLGLGYHQQMYKEDMIKVEGWLDQLKKKYDS